MIEFYVSGQSLKFFSPVIAADSLNYLTAKVNFTDTDWEGYSKWLHFRRGEELYDLQLDANDEITAAEKLNLTIGQWEIYLTGTKGESRLTTVPVILTVQQSGLIDAPLHELPMSVAERVDFNATQALLLAQAVKDMADAGDFDGESFAIYGYFESEADLSAAFPEGDAGRAYGVGSAAPYDIYVWDSVHNLWVNNGPMQGSPGETGEDGAVFIPSVDANGNISWTNDGGLENPVTRNIRGPAGPEGQKGEDGAGAYEKAQAAGYTGTEATFYQALTAMPYHNARHLPGGADPIVVQTGNIADAAVTAAKLAQSARLSAALVRGTSDFTASDLGETVQNPWGSSASYTLSRELSAAMPLGACFALLRAGDPGDDFHVLIKADGVRLGIADEGCYSSDVSLELMGYCSIAALRKVKSDSADGDIWVAYGNVEVC